MFSAYSRGADGTLHERFGLPLEALAAGQVFVHRPGITFTQQENVDEALSTLNSAQVHYDEEHAARTAWRRPLVVSTWTLQRLLGMTWKTFGVARRRIEGMHDVRMTRPVFAGDTLSARTEVLNVGARGRVRLRTEADNQRGEVVASADYTVSMWREHELPQPLRRVGEPAVEPRFASHVGDAGRWLETFGLCFEDLRAGETFAHAPRRLLEAHEIAALARRALDWSPRPLDACEVPQAWLLGLATALTTLTFGRVSANLGWSDVRFLHDPRAGDLLQARSTIVDTRLSRSRTDEGIAQVHTTLLDGEGREVLDFRRALLVYRRGHEPRSLAAGAPAAAHP